VPASFAAGLTFEPPAPGAPAGSIFGMVRAAAHGPWPFAAPRPRRDMPGRCPGEPEDPAEMRACVSCCRRERQSSSFGRRAGRMRAVAGMLTCSEGTSEAEQKRPLLARATLSRSGRRARRAQITDWLAKFDSARAIARRPPPSYLRPAPGGAPRAPPPRGRARGAARPAPRPPPPARARPRARGGAADAGGDGGAAGRRAGPVGAALGQTLTRLGQTLARRDSCHPARRPWTSGRCRAAGSVGS